MLGQTWDLSLLASGLKLPLIVLPKFRRPFFPEATTRIGKLPHKNRPVDQYGTPKLSQREVQVIQLVAQGLNNREIAKELGIGQYAVRNYVYKIYDKIGVSNRVELALWYASRIQERGPLQ